MISPQEVLPEDFCLIWYEQNLSVLYEKLVTKLFTNLAILWG